MATQAWNIDTAHSGIHFSVRHLVISKVHGAFEKWQGTVEFDAANPAASRVEVRIDASSITTREAKRDAHLRSPDFLDVEKFPELAFVSTKVEKLDGDEYRVTGDLTIHGVTKSVVLATEFVGGAKDPWGGDRIGFSATTSILRKDFGLAYNQVLEAGGVLIGDKLEITLEVQAVKAVVAKVA